MSIHQALVHERLDLHYDACNTLDAHRHGRSDEREEVGHSYYPCHGGRYYGDEDQSPSLDLPRPQAFG